jgi:uroporphyrinogen-III synthase
VKRQADAALITRPHEDSQDLAGELQRRGYRPLIEPMLRIVFRAGPPLSREGLQGLLVTSANGARALAARLGPAIGGWRDLPVWAVGDASAAAARACGFTLVENAAGDVSALAALVAERADPAAGALLQAAAATLAGDLAGDLGRRGFRVEKQVLYDAEPARRLSDAALAEMRQGSVAVALFFSPRTAATFVRLARAASLAEASAGVTALALSPAVAASLADMPWRRLVVAEQPRQSALLAALDGV